MSERKTQQRKISSIFQHMEDFYFVIIEHASSFFYNIHTSREIRVKEQIVETMNKQLRSVKSKMKT